MIDNIVEYYREFYSTQIHMPTPEQNRKAMLVCAGRVDYADQLEELLMCLGLIEYRY